MSPGASVVIRSIGIFEPEKRLTNNELANRVDTSDEWIVTRTGIRERRIAGEGETVAWMGSEAAKDALRKAGLEAGEVDLVINATMTPDVQCPSTACYVQEHLGIDGVPAFDVQAACSGFLYALEVGRSLMLGNAQYRNVLVIGSERMSRVLDWEDRSTCVLFGDGAGAAVLSKVNTGGIGILDSELKASGKDAGLLCIPEGGKLEMNGREVFKRAILSMEECAMALLERNGLGVNDIDWWVPHQANIRIIEGISGRLGVSMDRFIVNIAELGNTSSASIPLALNKGVEEGLIRPGQVVLALAFGAGFTWGSMLVKWV